MIEDLAHEGDAGKEIVAWVSFLLEDLLVFGEDLRVEFIRQIGRDGHVAVGDELCHLCIAETEGLVRHAPAT